MWERYSAHILVISVAALTALGLVILISVGQVGATDFGDSLHHATSQLRAAGVGLVLLLGLACVPYERLRLLAWPGLLAAVVLLALCFVPGIGLELNGARRWVDLGLTFQPSELAKVAVVLFLAAWYCDPERWKKNSWREVLLPLLVAGVPLLLIASEKDLGSAALMGAVVFVVLFVAGIRLVWLAAFGVVGAGGLVYLVMESPERVARVAEFREFVRDPGRFSDKTGEMLQQLMALEALEGGGLFGKGLGNSLQKLLHLPYDESDFIFAILGEELGLQGSLLVVFLFVLFVLAGMGIALHARDRFGMILGTGLVAFVAIQALINLAVVTGSIPNKGMPLPFISKGGSNLIFCLAATGVLVSIHRFRRPEEETPGAAVRMRRITPCV